MGVIQPQGKELREASEAGRGKEDSSPRASGVSVAYQHLDFRLPAS